MRNQQVGKKGVLIVMNYRPNRGGLTGAVENLIRSLRSEGYRISIASTWGGIRHRIKGVLLSFLWGAKEDRIIGVGCAFRGFFPIVVASMVAWILKKPVLFNFHDGQAPVFLENNRRLVKYVLKGKKVVVASQFVADTFAKYGLNKVCIPYHFNYEEEFCPRIKPFEWNRKIIWALTRR